MIRKLKHIINKENLPSPTTPQSPHDHHQQAVVSEMLKSLHSETPANFIKRKFKSTKSWAKLSKYPKLFKDNEEEEEDPTYESMPNLEFVHHEFESYLSKMWPHQQREASRQAPSSQSTDYGFESSCDLTSLSSSAARRNSSVKHSTLNSHNNAAAAREDESLMANAENQLYFRILQRLANTSLAKPENIPLLCVKSFRSTDYEWAQLVARLGMTNRDDIQLIELNQGLPVNAMHYLPCLDLVYVKTADDLIGYLPRTHCKAIASTHSNSHKENDAFKAPLALRPYKPEHQNHRLTFHAPKTSYEEAEKEELVEYHSLSSFEFCNDANTKHQPLVTDNDKLFKPITQDQSITEHPVNHQTQTIHDQKQSSTSGSSLSNTSFTYEPINIIRSSDKPARDSVFGKQSSQNLQLVSGDYEDCSDLAIGQTESPIQLERCLSGLQSRSRLPISLRSNFNLTLMDSKPREEATTCKTQENAPPSPGFQHHESYLNLISSQVLKPSQKSSARKKNNFGREKYVRQSLDSSLMSNKKLFAIPIDFRDDHSQIDREHTSSKFRYNFMKQLDHFKQKNALKYTDSPEPNPSTPITKPALACPDLDIGKIELDSIKDTSIAQYLREVESQGFPTPDKSSSRESDDRLWTVILQHEAKSPRELSVWPGYVILVIKENKDWLYVKLVKGDQLNAAQQYGFIPRNCAINFQELMTRSKRVEKKEATPADHSRRSLVTAL